MLLGCSSEDPEERLASAQSAFTEGTICTDGASDPPVLVSWLFNFTGIQQATSLTVRLDPREAVTVVLDLVSEGLDFRRVERPYGSYSLTPGTRRDVVIRLSDLPLQGVSYSSLGTVKVTVTRQDGSILTLWAPPFYHHFSASYGTPSVYTFDTMTEALNGGQHTTDAFDLRGRVWYNNAWIDIRDLRNLEWQQQYSLPAPPAAGSMIGWGAIGSTLTQPASGYAINVDWETRYIDAAHGEDFVNAAGTQFSDASYAYAKIARVISTPCAAYNPNDPCLSVVWEGYLNANGHVKLLNPVRDQSYHIFVYSKLQVSGNINAEVQLHHNNGDPFPPQYWRMSFYVPPLNSILPDVANLTTFFHMVAHGTAVLSQLFKSELTILNSSYTVHTNLDCPGIPNNACAQNGNVWAGKWLHPTPGVPGDLQYKYVMAHEVGHIVQEWGSGIARWDFDGTPYDNGSSSLAACTCSHVVTSNQYHCLQSNESTAVAQAEAFGHFTAARLFNDAAGSDCKFNYYKEFRLVTGEPWGPPYNANCRSPSLWRDTFCTDSVHSQHGTELDWLQFFWNVNTVGSSTSHITNLYAIWKRACVTYPASCQDQIKLLWNDPNINNWDLLRGAETQYGSVLDPRYQKFFNDGSITGVDDAP